MKLLSITLDGEYKGLRSDTFDFSQSEGRLLAFIGLNGSGKSQLLELIAESFACLERKQRKDFKTKNSLGFNVSLSFEINTEAEQLSHYLQTLILLSTVQTKPTFKVKIDRNGEIETFFLINNDWQDIESSHLVLPEYVVGYSSGLNENLQRSFMKNAVQYNDVMRTRLNLRKKLLADIDEEQRIVINKEFLQNNPQLCDMPPFDQLEEHDFLELRENISPIPSLMFMDYDSNSLLLAAICLLPKQELYILLAEAKYNIPKVLEFRYNLRGDIANEDVIRDIKLLIRLAGEENISGIGQQASDEQYELFELTYLSGLISFDLTCEETMAKLKEAHLGSPIAFFKRLYRLQLAGVQNWEGTTRSKLKRCDFKGTVKKPQKSKLPLSVERLELASENGTSVNIDDFSDGEAQLIQILAAARIFRDEQTLFLFDEPETHLNPSWRTYFHKHLAQANQVGDVWTNSTQTLLSTHSPFMISSLKKSDVYRFERDNDGLIKMNRAENQTYGASFDVLIKEYFDLKSLISQTVVEDIKAHLPKGDSQEEKDKARAWLNENIGESMEKAYLLRKLQE
jgi:restriction system-associated AAA family ATPase